MQNLAKLELQRRALRSNICRICSVRPEGSESLGPDVPRKCEPTCTIFVNLPKLERIEQRYDDPTISRYERAVRDLVCQMCTQTPTAGDYCDEGETRRCPLSLYLQQVIDTLERVEHV